MLIRFAGLLALTRQPSALLVPPIPSSSFFPVNIANISYTNIFPLFLIEFYFRGKLLFELEYYFKSLWFELCKDKLNL